MKTLAYRFIALLFAALLAASLTAQTPVRVVSIVSLAAGSNAIGKLAANSGVDIGDVDVTSSALPTGASTLAEQQAQTTALQLIDNAISGAGFNITQINGVTPLMGNGATGTGSQRVTLANDSSAIAVKGEGAIGAAPPSGAQQAGGITSGATGGLMAGIPICDSFYNVNMVTATTALWITGVSGRHIRICSISLVAAGADNVGIISGTGATCGTSTAAIVGTTAATGFNLSANGGIAHGSGIGTIMRTTDAGDSICGITSAAVQLSGVISYTIY